MPGGESSPHENAESTTTPFGMELIIGTVLLVGAIYFYSVQKKKPFTPVVPPDEDAPLPAPPESEGFKV